jgi:hypothetical protein
LIHPEHRAAGRDARGMTMNVGHFSMAKRTAHRFIPDAGPTPSKPAEPLQPEV